MGVRRRNSQRQRQRASKANQAAVEAAESTPESALAATSAKAPRFSTDICEFDDVFAAIESLYVDELKPFGRILRKRVAECAALAAGADPTCEVSLPHFDIKQLHATCEASDSLLVEPEEGGDWSVLIVDRPQTFVNVYSPLDEYPSSMWTAAASYFQDLTGSDMYLPGGRYSCAQALQARCLEFLQGRSLGEVCHIVQLAISKKKLLGYLNGAVVPYAHSQSMVKENCAHLNAPCTASNSKKAPGAAAAAGSSFTMATWETARQFLREILDRTASTGTLGMVPLSNVKRLFRSKFQTELSETMLGHSKLSELLQDERFSDICNVELQGNGYIVMQVQQDADSADSMGGRLPVLLGEPLALNMDASGVSVVSSKGKENGGPLASNMDASPMGKENWWPSEDGFVTSLVQRTFIHAQLPPPTPPPNARQRSASLPKEVGSTSSPEIQCPALGFRPCRTKTESTIGSTTASAADGAGAQVPSRSLTPSDQHSQSCRSDHLPGPALEATVKFLLRKCDLRANAETTENGEPFVGDVMDFSSAEDPERARPLFCLDEPLSLEEAGLFLDLESSPCMHTPTPSSAWWPCLSPSLRKRDGCVGSIALSKVHNTFIHSPMPPPTPLRGDASRRSQSLPKNIGSGKDAWETTCQALGCSHVADAQEVCERAPLASLPTPSVYGSADFEFDSGNSLPTPSIYGPAEFEFNAGNILPTPSVYGPTDFAPWFNCATDCIDLNLALDFASLPAYVPPSPALTASPTYCSRRQLLSNSLVGAQRPPFFFSPFLEDLTPESNCSEVVPSAGPPSAIRLADLLY